MLKNFVIQWKWHTSSRLLSQRPHGLSSRISLSSSESSVFFCSCSALPAIFVNILHNYWDKADETWFFPLENLVENSLQRQQKEEKMAVKIDTGEMWRLPAFRRSSISAKVSRYNVFGVRYERNRYRSTHESSDELNRTCNSTKSQHIESKYHFTGLETNALRCKKDFFHEIFAECLTHSYSANQNRTWHRRSRHQNWPSGWGQGWVSANIWTSSGEGINYLLGSPLDGSTGGNTKPRGKRGPKKKEDPHSIKWQELFC